MISGCIVEACCHGISWSMILVSSESFVLLQFLIAWVPDVAEITCPWGDWPINVFPLCLLKVPSIFGRCVSNAVTEYKVQLSNCPCSSMEAEIDSTHPGRELLDPIGTSAVAVCSTMWVCKPCLWASEFTTNCMTSSSVDSGGCQLFCWMLLWWIVKSDY